MTNFIQNEKPSLTIFILITIRNNKPLTHIWVECTRLWNCAKMRFYFTTNLIVHHSIAHTHTTTLQYAENISIFKGTHTRSRPGRGNNCVRGALGRNNSFETCWRVVTQIIHINASIIFYKSVYLFVYYRRGCKSLFELGETSVRAILHIIVRARDWIARSDLTWICCRGCIRWDLIDFVDCFVVSNRFRKFGFDINSINVWF